MSIGPLKTARKSRRIVVYDLEWYPDSYKLRLVGVRCRDRGQRRYFSIEEFLQRELIAFNSGKLLYAHAGGLSDMHYILHELKKNLKFRHYEVKASFSGGSAIIVKVKRGKLLWTFVDSLWTLRDKLSAIGKWIGIRKLVSDGIFDAPIAELIEYNDRDCEVLLESLEAMQKLLWENEGELKLTMASSALCLFRRKFLTRNIHTNRGINKFLRNSYYSSRVEWFNRTCDHAWRVDINSSFPNAMCEPLPCNLLRSDSRIRTDTAKEYYFADVELEIPEMYLPPTPIRRKGRIFFPVGRLPRCWYSQTDIELALSVGGKILKTHEVLVYDLFTDLRDFALWVWAQRAESKSAFEKKGWKLIGNSGYGKFGEHELKMEMLMHPPNSGRRGDVLLEPGILLRPLIAKVPHQHIPISSSIVAIARRNLYNHDMTELNAGGTLYYNDTDSIDGSVLLPTGKGLGELKLEYEIFSGEYLQPKLYRLTVMIDQAGWRKETDAEDNDVNWGAMVSEKRRARPSVVYYDVIRGKGFRRLKRAEFEALKRGEKVPIERMRRVWEQLKEREMENRFGPHSYHGMKGINRATLGKRFEFPDGSTRPWTMKEIEENFPASPPALSCV